MQINLWKFIMENKGVLIFAHNNSVSIRDYLFSAWVCACTIKNENRDISVSLFTKDKDLVSESQSYIYDNILEFPFGDAGHEDNNTLTNLCQIYYATPYEQTLVLDADTLVLGKLDGLFASVRRYDLLFPHAIKDYRNVIHDVKNKLHEKNNLPEFETSVWYFNKNFNKEKYFYWDKVQKGDRVTLEKMEAMSSEEDSEPFFNLLELYLRNHKKVYEQFENNPPGQFDKNFLLSVVVDNLDLLDEVMDLDILTYTDLSTTHDDWYKELNYWITKGCLKIENYNITGIINYGKDAFTYEELDKLARRN